MGFRRWACVVTGSLTGLVWSAAASAQLSDNWQSLSTSEFAAAVEATLESGSIEPDVHDQTSAAGPRDAVARYDRLLALP